jgi:hypothetical protein
VVPTTKRLTELEASQHHLTINVQPCATENNSVLGITCRHGQALHSRGGELAKQSVKQIKQCSYCSLSA